jgi:hypothetical protein
MHHPNKIWEHLYQVLRTGLPLEDDFAASVLPRSTDTTGLIDNVMFTKYVERSLDMYSPPLSNRQFFIKVLNSV